MDVQIYLVAALLGIIIGWWLRQFVVESRKPVEQTIDLERFEKNLTSIKAMALLMERLIFEMKEAKEDIDEIVEVAVEATEEGDGDS